MDGGPFRTSRPVERRSATPAHRQPEAPVQPAATDKPKAVAHRTAPHQSTTQKASLLARLKWPLFGALLILLVLAVWFVYTQARGSAASAIDGNKYQAVFFDDGQVYFGNLEVLSADSMKLTDVFYLKSSTGGDGTDNPQESTESSADDRVQLIKLGKEIHGPEDAMIINRDQVLFFENLQDGSQVSKLMKDYKG